MRYLFLLLVLAIVLFSCEQDEVVYSCDPEIDAIVKSASVEFSEIRLTEFLEYDIVLQKAIFRSFSSEKKRNFWLEKLDSVLSVNEFNIDEKLHVEKLKAELIPGYFNIAQLDSVDYNNRLQFSEDWATYAADSLNWSKTKTNYIRYSLYITEVQYSIGRNELQENTINTLQYECNCSSEADECGDGGLDCGEGGCSETSWGCGLFWTNPCTGLCQ